MNQYSITTPALRRLIEALWSLGEGERLPATLMGIGPMSPNLIRGTLAAGRDWDFPVIFIASRNQIDTAALGGGYVQGWDQQAFVQAVDEIAQEVNFRGLYYICRDHGGPWQRDEEYRAKLAPDEAMAQAMTSYQADIDAGFDLLHIDPTKDPLAEGLADLAVVADRVVELIAGCEEYQARTNASAVCYEVGTEETVGGLTSPKTFEGFIVDLLQRLEAQSLPRPVFIVGQTGTLIKMRQNIGTYDPINAQTLSHIARRYGLAFKEHNSDYLPADNLAQHPAWGITGANFGPSFAHTETAACLELAAQEAQAVGGTSEFHERLAEAAFDCGRWRKWLLPEHKGIDDEAIRSDSELFDETVRVAGHYVLDEPAVAAARQQMYHNLQTAGVVAEGERYVVDSIKAFIGEHAKSLGLVGITSRLRRAL